MAEGCSATPSLFIGNTRQTEISPLGGTKALELGVKVSKGWEFNRETREWETLSDSTKGRVGKQLGKHLGCRVLDPSLVPRSNVGLYP